MKKILTLLILLPLALDMACHREKTSGSGTVQTSDGTSIRYQSYGQGDTALVFIHCWACNRHYWDGQIQEFSKDYRVVTFDLAGHGESGKTRQEWKVANFVQDLDAIFDQLKIKRAILIGHSMGGSIALAVAAARPDEVKGIVCVDTLQNVEENPVREQMKKAADQMEIDFPKTVQAFIPNFFYKDTDPQVVKWAVDQASKTDPKVAAGLTRDMADLDLRPWMAAVKVPIRCINSSEGVGGLHTNVEADRKYADFEMIPMAKVGHFIQLEKPAEFNQALRQVLAQLSAPAPH